MSLICKFFVLVRIRPSISMPWGADLYHSISTCQLFHFGRRNCILPVLFVCSHAYTNSARGREEYSSAHNTQQMQCTFALLKHIHLWFRGLHLTVSHVENWVLAALHFCLCLLRGKVTWSYDDKTLSHVCGYHSHKPYSHKTGSAVYDEFMSLGMVFYPSVRNASYLRTRSQLI